MNTDLLTDDFIGVIGAHWWRYFTGFGVSISGISAICGCILRALVFQIRQCAAHPMPLLSMYFVSIRVNPLDLR